MYLLIYRTHWSLFPMVLLQHTCTIDIKEWVPSYELTRTNFIKKKNQHYMQLQNRETDYRYDSKHPHGLAFTRRGCFLTKLAHSFLSHLCLSFCLPESLTCTSFHPSTSPDTSAVSSSDCPFCLHRPFTYISLLYKPSFCHFSFSYTLSVPRSRKMLVFWAGRKSCIYIVHLQDKHDCIALRKP